MQSVDPHDTYTCFAPYPQVFRRTICDGCLSTNHKPMQSGSVSDALQNVDQAYKWMGPLLSEWTATEKLTSNLVDNFDGTPKEMLPLNE